MPCGGPSRKGQRELKRHVTHFNETDLRGKKTLQGGKTKSREGSDEHGVSVFPGDT